MRRLIAIAALLLLSSSASFAQEAEAPDNSFGAWFFTEVNHDFKCGAYLTGYFEHDSYQFSRFDCVYGRLCAGWKLLPWLKAGINYIPLYDNSGWKHYYETDVVGTLKSGNFKVSIRERYRHCITSGSNELRSRLKVAYSIPDSPFGVYLAPEVFTWGDKWKKTRHYVAGTWNVNSHIQLEAYYLYYAYNGAPAEHFLGLGLNFDI